MAEVVKLTYVFLGFVLVFFAVMSLFFPEQVGQKIGQLTKLKVAPDQLSADFTAAESNYLEAAKGREDLPDEQKRRAQLEAAAGSARIMWVDDRPENNRAIIALLVNLGHRVEVAQSNNEAVKFYALAAYDLIISDIARKSPGEQGGSGLLLPDRLKAARGGLPALIYYVRKVDAALTESGHPVVNRPSELLRLIHVALNLDVPEGLFQQAH